MQPDNLNVFDFDGTLIKVNSFKEVTKNLSIALLKKFKIASFLALTGFYITRKLCIISHIKFKQYVVDTFEKSLTESEKQNISQRVFDNNVNTAVLERMLGSDNCVICTAAPFAYMSRMYFGRDVPVISALDPRNRFPDMANFGTGKVKNIKAYFEGKSVKVANFYTDSSDDKELIDFAANAFIVKDGHIVKIK